MSSSSRLQMKRGTGKMRNRYRVGSDQFLCLYFSSSSHLFCSQFLFLLCLSLLVWVFLAASLSPSILVSSLGAVFLITQVCKFSALEASGYWGASSRTQLNAQRKMKVQEQPIHPGLSCYNGQVPGTILAHIPQQAQRMPNVTAVPQIWLEVAGLSD